MRAAQPVAVAVAQGAPAVAAPVAAVPRPVAAAAPAAAPVAAAAGAAACPQCGHVNAPSNKFCASCGYNMSLISGAPPAAAPVAAPAAAAGAGQQVILTALRADGTEAGSFALPGQVTSIGRDAG